MKLSSLFDVVADIIVWIWIMLTKKYSLHAVLHHYQYWPCTFNNSTSLVIFQLLNLMLMALDFFLQTLNLFLVVVDLLLVVFP